MFCGATFVGHIACYCTAALHKTTHSERGEAQLEIQEPASEKRHTHLETNLQSELDRTVKIREFFLMNISAISQILSYVIAHG